MTTDPTTLYAELRNQVAHWRRRAGIAEAALKELRRIATNSEPRDKRHALAILGEIDSRAEQAFCRIHGPRLDGDG